MFVSRGILSFDELLRKSIYRFFEIIENSTNSIIHACLSSSVFIYSSFCKWWSSLLYLWWHCTDMLVLVFFIHLSFMLILYIASYLCVALFFPLFYSVLYIYNNNNDISFLQTHGQYTYKKNINIYKNSIIIIIIIIIIISQSKIVVINITLISTIAEWESEYKQ